MSYKLTLLLAVFMLILHISLPESHSGSTCYAGDDKYSVKIPQKILEGKPEDSLKITSVLKPDTLPMGYFVSNTARVIQAPESPEIVPGFPDIRVVCPVPGKYVLQVTLSILSKSSCGGIDACSMDPETVTIWIND